LPLSSLFSVSPWLCVNIFLVAAMPRCVSVALW
jgi:hypothetical protein